MDRSLLLALTYCEHGSLRRYLFKRALADDPIGEKAKLRFALHIAQGMAHIASKNFVHRDLAARNVMVSTGYICKVGDFGLTQTHIDRRAKSANAQHRDSYAATSSGVMLPIRWTSSEVLETGQFTTFSDVWAYAIVCIEMVRCFLSHTLSHFLSFFLTPLFAISNQPPIREPPIVCIVCSLRFLTDLLALKKCGWDSRCCVTSSVR
jgi:serine/threonine protein kinase